MKQKNGNGFSLIELIATLALFSLIVTLTVANFSFLHRGLVRSELHKLFCTCMYLQRSAMSSGQQQELYFDVKNNSYRFDGKTETLAPHVHFGMLAQVKGPPSSPKKVLHSPCSFKGDTITFTPDGIISSGTVYLIDSKKHVLYALSSGVASISYLRKYHYTDKWNQIS